MKILKILSSLFKNLVLFLIRFYQKFLSIDQSFWGRRLGVKVCIYHPYCSEYTYQAIEKYGVIKGSILGIKRIARCNPSNKGGYDPVP